MSGHAISWAELGRGARLFRTAHGVLGAFNMAALGYVWYAAMGRRRDRFGRASVGLLGAEGIALVIGRGNCPFGSLQRSLGDPGPMFEWFLPPGAAAFALIALVLRPPR